MTIEDGRATYAGEGLTIVHEGETLELGADPVTRDLAELEAPEPVHQPRHRAPRRRRP